MDSGTFLKTGLSIVQKTALHSAHLAASARMAEFAGYDMPLYYPAGALKEHEWVRTETGLFDVSHMAQIVLEGKGEDPATFLERLTPSAFGLLSPFRARYTVLTNENGGIVDDLIVTRLSGDRFFAVLNAGCRDKDIAWIRQHMPSSLSLSVLSDRALLALQGPGAEVALRKVTGFDAADLAYMQMAPWGGDMFISRLGYTGEDGFEISLPGDRSCDLWTRFLEVPGVRPIGLAARDSLRLEMGYCLYGHDIDDTTTPIEADLSWVMRRGASGYIGEKAAIAAPPSRKRVGLVLKTKGIAREGAPVFSSSGEHIGALSSGGYAPSLAVSIGQAYLPLAFSAPGTSVMIKVREVLLPAEVAPMPFRPPRTKTGKNKP